MTTVSVAMATFNGVRHLAEQLDSIAAGTRRPEEIVVSDDGSTDGTAAFLRAQVGPMAKRGVRLHVLEGPRLGVVRNFERALLHTSGDLVALCDQDDVWHPDRLEVGCAALEADITALLHHSDATLVDDGGVPLGRTLFETLPVHRYEFRALLQGPAFPALLRRNLMTGATVLIRRELIALAAPFPEEWVHDEWLAIIAAAHGATRTETRPLIDYRQHDANQIGVQHLTLRRALARMFAVSPERHRSLALRAELLERRLSALGVEAEILSLVRQKRAFEERCLRYPRARVLRIPRILDGLLRGDYRRFSSRRNLDGVRDFVAAPAAAG